MLTNTRIKRLIKRNHVKTITVDVFDTLLMRKVYPEDLQFIMHGERAAQILEAALKKRISPEYFYSLRKFCRRIIDDSKQAQKYDRESHIEEIFSLMLTRLCQQYEVELSKEEQNDLIKRLIDAELDIETQKLKPNNRLIKLLRQQKDKGIKLYFISDIYLDTQHIQTLFQGFGISDLFEGGICSANVGYCKGTGKLFKKMSQKQFLAEVSLLSNLHIGDNKISDYLSPKKHGSLAYHLNCWHHRVARPLKTMAGKIVLNFKLWAYHRGLRRQLKHASKAQQQDLSKPQQQLYEIGWTMGPALHFYLNSLQLHAHFNQSPIYFLSSEGKILQYFLKELNSTDSGKILKSFNRLNTLRSFAYLSLTKPAIKYSQAIVNLFFHGEGKKTLKDLLKSMGIEPRTWGLSDLALHHMPAEKFVAKLIRILRKKDHQELRQTYQTIVHELSDSGLLNHKRVIFGDAGWSGTIQILLEQMLDLLNKKISTQGIYLGATGHNIFGLKKRKNIKGIVYPHLKHHSFRTMLVEEVWEYVLSGKNKSPEKQRWILKGMLAYFAFAEKQLQYSPDRLHLISQKELYRLFYHPNREQILLLGAIEHDAGFGSDKQRSLVDLSYTKLSLYKLLLTQPAKFRELYLEQYWQRGFLKWYRLRFAIPLAHGFHWLRQKTEQVLG